jgi:hypothetical protein
MSFLGLVPHSAVSTIEPRGIEEPISAEQFVERLQSRFSDLERTLTKGEQLDIVAFLPSGKALSVDCLGYENPSLVILNGREQETGRRCTLLAHQSAVQVLVSVEPVEAGERRKVLRFTREK